jgi:HB1, ASXL, restriction endonuclease HTH domain
MASKKKTPASPRATQKTRKATPAAAPEPAAPTEPAAMEPAAPAEATPKRSALESAVQVLRAEGRPMTCGELIAAMAAKNFWTSPAGKTPASTLYASILKEVTTKGAEARFVKVARGQFALRESAR